MNIAIISLSPDLRTLGALNISTYLKHNGYQNSFLHFVVPYFGGGPSESASDSLVSFLKSQNAQIICISLTTFYFNVAKNLTLRIKQVMPSSRVIWGGIHPTSAPEECLNYCDIVCLGEGEEPLLELIQKMEQGVEFSETKNFWVKTNNGICKNDLRPLCQDLDQRPYPRIDWENSFILHRETLVPLTMDLFNKYRPKESTIYEIMASRGCPFSCTYCCNSIYKELYRNKGKILRFRSVDHIISELEYVQNTFPTVKIFNLEDDAFGGADDDFIKRFCAAYKAKIKLPFHIRIIPTMISEKKIILLKEAGLISAVMGLQGSDKMNIEIYKRPTTQKVFIDVATMLRRNKIIGRYDVITNNPYSTEEDEVEAIRTFMRVPKPYALYIYPLAFFPFSELTTKAIRDGKYNPASAGYVSIYGNVQNILFPVLMKIIQMTAYTPSVLTALFLKIRKHAAGVLLIYLYFNTVFRLEMKLIEQVKKNARTIFFFKKLLFLWDSVTNKP